MAGHSKWKNIQHRKGAQDAKRGKVFTKIAIELTVATRAGGDNPDDNPRLRTALAKAKAANMPKENYEKAIKKGAGKLEGVNYVEKTYEGYGPGGVAIFVKCLTDNHNRTVMKVRHAFTKSGGNLATDGSVSWMFDEKGIIVYDKNKINDHDKFIEDAIEAGAEDIKDEDNFLEIECLRENLINIKKSLDSMCDLPEVCEISMIPKDTLDIDQEKKDKLQKLIDKLEDDDDVQNVYSNINLKNN